MFFCYAGLMMVATIFVICLWQAFRQWYKAEAFQKQRSHEGESSRTDHQLKNLEEDCRAYAFGCLIAAAVAALIELVAGGIVWGCGG